MASRLPLRQVVDTIGHDVHPPLWYVLTHLWEQIGGMRPLWLKSFPLLLALANIAVTYRLARRTLGTAAALLAAALIALNHSHLRFSQEAQSFALEWLLVMLVVNTGWDWIETRRTRSAVGYLLFGTLAMYTHYISLAILFTFGVWGVFRLRREGAACARWIGFHALLALAFMPQLPIEIRQFVQDDAWRRGHFAAPDDWLTLGRVIAFEKTYLIPVMILLALLPFMDPARRRIATLLWSLAVFPIFAVRLWALNFPREIVYIVPLFMPLVAAGVLRLPGVWTRRAVIVLMLVAAASPDRARTDFPEPVMLMRAKHQLDAMVRPGDVIVHSETHSLLFFRLYDPGRDHFLLWPPEQQVPYYEGGLIVPSKWCIAPATWDTLRASDARWWAVALNRAQILPGHGFTRTGLSLDSLARSTPGVRELADPPVLLWGSASTARNP